MSYDECFTLYFHILGKSCPMNGEKQNEII